MEEGRVGGLLDVVSGLGVGEAEAEADHVEDLDWNPGLAVSEVNLRIRDDVDVVGFGRRVGVRVEGDGAFRGHECCFWRRGFR